MRMKFNKSGQLLTVAAASLMVSGLLTACDQLTGTLTVDFVYVTSAKAAGPNNYGEVDVFEINSQSGHMRQIPASPFPSGGRNPVAEAVSSDNADLYVVNEDDNTIVQFIIGTDGKLYPQNTTNTNGVFPVAVTVSGKNLFVADTYQPLPTCSNASPCPGAVSGWPLQSDDSINRTSPFVNSSISAPYWPLNLPGSPSDIVTPTAIKASPNGSNLYVAAWDTTANAGYVFAFAIGTGELTPLNGGVPTPAGIHPSALTVDPTGAYLYVTDMTGNSILGYSISGNSLTPLGGSPFPAGNKPSSIAIDAKANFAYVANSLDSNVTGYSISAGELTRIASYAADTQPVAIGIDPALNQYVFTANFLANTVSGFQINATNGTLLNSQFSPFTSNANPTAVAAIPHGAVAK
jgi:6-phosphogluconolactonase